MTSEMSNDEKDKGSRKSSSANRKTISNQNSRLKQGTEVFPSLKKDLQNAKLFLQQSSNESGDSLYEHLTRVITKVIDERPSNVVDSFELYSERVRLEKFRMQDMRIEVAYKEPDRLTSAQRMLPIRIDEYNQQQQKQRQHMNKNKNEMKSMASTNSVVMDDREKEEVVLEDDEQNDVIYYESPAVKDLCELQFYWNLLGIGFPREETFSLSCAIRKLKTNASISTCRFFGKILGLRNDYYIAECTLTEDALKKRTDAVEKAINIMSLEPLNVEFSDQQRKSSSNASSMRFESTSVIGKKNEIKKSAVVVATSNDTSSVSDSMPNKTESNETIDENKRKEYPTEWNFSMNIPQTSYRRPIEIPAEEIGHGVNRYVYYVCTNLYDEWIELPLVTPHQINVSRRIKKYFTGNLDAEILSYPIFPGTERNYLRAIIARISSSTHVAPQNFYEIGSNRNVIDGNNEDVEEEDDDFDEDKCNNDKPIKVNASYHPLPLDKLLKLDHWMHIKPEILKQGRVCYFDGRLLINNQVNDNDDVDDESSVDDDDDEENVTEITNIEMRPEMPVPLFASCSGDRLTNDIISPWTIRLSDVIVESPLVLLQSNIWSGAFTFVKDRICDNIYIGYGCKYTSLNYSPTSFLPQVEMEYPHGEDVVEANDPSVDVEKEWQRQQIMDQNNHSSNDDDVLDEVEIDD